MALTDRMVFAKANGWEDTLLAQSWGVRGYPTLILMRPDETEIDRIAGYLPAADFVKVIEDYMSGRGTLDDLRARVEEYPDSMWLWLQIGEKYQYRGQDSLAESTYGRILKADPTNRAGYSDSALHRLGRIAYSGGSDNHDTAVARFSDMIRRFPRSGLVEDAETWIPYILAKQEKYEEALARYEKFLQDHPESGEAEWVQQQIDRIKARDGG